MCLQLRLVPKSELVPHRALGIGQFACPPFWDLSHFEPFHLDRAETAEVLFIFSGAFTGMNDIIKNRVGAPAISCNLLGSAVSRFHPKPGRYQIHGISAWW